MIDFQFSKNVSLKSKVQIDLNREALHKENYTVHDFLGGKEGLFKWRILHIIR